MILHIVKKDVRLLGGFSIAVIGLQLAFAFVQIEASFGQSNPILQQFGAVLQMLWLVASFVLVVALVQVDPVPGTRQDWLVRPIPHYKMFAAKLVFAAAVIQGATIASDLLQGLAGGFTLYQTMLAALSRAILGFVAITLPALVLGAITETIAAATVIGILLIGAGFLFTVMAVAAAGSDHQFDPTNMTGVEWIPNTFRYALILIVLLPTLAWQYQTRRTPTTRAAILFLGIALLASQLIPWNPVFAIQKNFSERPGTARAIALAWRPANIGGSHSPADAGNDVAAGAVGPHITLPILIQGLPADSVLKQDKAVVRILDESGRQLFASTAEDLEVRHEDGRDGNDEEDQLVRASGRFLQAYRREPVVVKADYSLTLFALRGNLKMKALSDYRMLPGWGRCKTEADDSYTAVELECLQVGKGPTCATVFLRDPGSGEHNKVNTACYPNYSPYLERPIPDAMTHFRIVLPFRDPSKAEQFPINSARLDRAEVVIRVYEPIDHFTRVLRSPVIPLSSIASP